MGRHRRKLHELKPVRKANSAYVWYGSGWVPLGPWDTRRNQPSDAAEERLAKLKALWRVDPSAGVVRADDPLLFTVWNDWRGTAHAPKDRLGEIGRAERLLFGTPAEPGPHLLTLASAFTAGDLLAWQDHLCALLKPDGVTRRLSRDTVRQYVALVRKCLKWAGVAGRVPSALAAALADVPPPPRGSVREARVRAGVELGQLEAALGRITSRAGVVLRLLWLTGARPSELCRLKVGDVQTSGVVKPHKGPAVDLGDLWAAVLDKHKTAARGAERVIFFGPQSRALLAPLLAGRSADRPLLTTATGTAYTPHEVANRLRRACVRAELPPISPYLLRHSAAERVQAEFSAAIPGAGYLAAQAFLGHRVKGVTSGYSGSDLTTAAAVARRMG